MKRACLAVVVLLTAATAPVLATTDRIETRDGTAVARFENPTQRYGHDVLGGLPEWGRLCLEIDGAQACITLPETAVFEDIAPRLHDFDRDGRPEAVVVESTVTGGAQLAVYRFHGRVLQKVATPPIGQRNRWLAPVGMADFNADGRMDVAYVETPHLGKTLRIWTWTPEGMIELGSVRGVTNHRIGQQTVTSGLRNCGGTVEIILPDASWTRVAAIRFDGPELSARVIGNLGPSISFADYLDCPKT